MTSQEESSDIRTAPWKSLPLLRGSFCRTGWILSFLSAPAAQRSLERRGNLNSCLTLSSGMRTSSWMREVQAPWVWRMFPCLPHRSLSTSKNEYFSPNFAPCYSSKFLPRCQSSSLKASVSLKLLCRGFLPSDLSTVSHWAFLPSRKKGWRAEKMQHAGAGMTVVLLERTAVILSDTWGVTDHFHSHNHFLWSRFKLPFRCLLQFPLAERLKSYSRVWVF